MGTLMMSRFVPRGFGWRQSLPDYRDTTLDSPPVQNMLSRLSASQSDGGQRPEQVDLREYFPDATDQQHIHASTAHACVAAVEYFQRRISGKTTPLSPLFLYQTTRKMLAVTGDTGADLRTTCKALVSFGLPPERFWPYAVERLDEEPDAFLYSFAEPYRSLCYVRLDGRQLSGRQTLDVVRTVLAAGFPVVFGFSVPSVISQHSDIPYHPAFASVLGGQAVVAVGYDDRRLQVTRGALLIRSSWGAAWGDHGYGWLPYAYVTERLALDFWCLLHPDWLDPDEFARPHFSPEPMRDSLR